MKTARRCALALHLPAILIFAAAAHAETPAPVNQRSYKPYPPIEITSYVFEKPRPIRAWTAKIDLTSPDLEFVATCAGNVEGTLETECMATLTFAETNGVQLAVNASPFSPLRQKPGEGMDVVGLGACDGKVYSQPDDRFGALVVTRAGKVEIWSPPIDAARFKDIDDAVGGFRVLVENGASRADQISTVVDEKFAGVNPRTAAGLSADGETLWLIVADGRNKGRSEGMTLDELADFGISLGCHKLLNLDGGGSSTLVLQDPASKAYRVVNQPVGNGPTDTLRLVGNNFGVRVRSGGTNVPAAKP